MPEKLLLSTATLIAETVGFCTKCKRTTESRVIEENGRVFLEKGCCGERVLLDKDGLFFQSTKKIEEDLKVPTGLRAGEVHSLLSNQTTFHILYITRKCNLACPICFLRNIPTIGEDPSTEELEEFLTTLRPSIILFEGAEPTMREDLPLLIKIAKRAGHIVKIFTNGVKLEDESYVQKLKRAGLDGVYFSIDGFDERVISELRGKPLLHIYLKALRNLKKHRINTVLAITVKKGLNEQEVPRLLNFAIHNRNFIKAIFIGGVWLPDGTTLIPSFSYSEICDLLSRATGVPLEYFLELLRLRWNLYKLLSFLSGDGSKVSLLRGDTIYFKIKREKLVPLFEVDELMKINSWIEDALMERKRLSMFRKILSKPHLLFKVVNSIPLHLSLRFILSGFNQVRVYQHHINSSIFRIIIKSLVSYSNIDLLRPPGGERETFRLYPIQAPPLPE